MKIVPRLLCAVGLHAWIYPFPGHEGAIWRVRRCKRCHSEEPLPEDWTP